MKTFVALAASLVSAAAFTGGASAASCPASGALLAFDANPVAAAATAALRADPRSNRPQVTGALLATTDRARGLQARTMCGAQVWKRTVVVYVLDRALLPSASLSQRVVFVSRFRGGYRVWGRAH